MFSGLERSETRSSSQLLAKFLKGEKVKLPKEWNTFVEGLEPNYKEIIKTIENVIFPQSLTI